MSVRFTNDHRNSQFFNTTSRFRRKIFSPLFDYFSLTQCAAKLYMPRQPETLLCRHFANSKHGETSKPQVWRNATNGRANTLRCANAPIGGNCKKMPKLISAP